MKLFAARLMRRMLGDLTQVIREAPVDLAGCPLCQFYAHGLRHGYVTEALPHVCQEFTGTDREVASC